MNDDELQAGYFTISQKTGEITNCAAGCYSTPIIEQYKYIVIYLCNLLDEANEKQGCLCDHDNAPCEYCEKKLGI